MVPITKNMVIEGYNQGLIRLISSPNGDGIACQIGDNWFYFGGITAEEYDNVAEYKEIMLTSDIVTEIYDVLCEFKTEFEDEYLYYYYYLMENLKPETEKISAERFLTILKNRVKPISVFSCVFAHKSLRRRKIENYLSNSALNLRQSISLLSMPAF